MPTPAIMVLGTGSHVGKSLITTALCRIFRQHGVRVAPFKAQNMSLNSAVTPEGLEIGRAQALQAEAAGIPASVHMNPILLKPAGNMTSQVVVRGKIWGQLSAADYHQRRVEELLPIVRESYEILAASHDLIVLEGAGSPAEINLKQHDIVNMRMAKLATAACLLVGDIDRGGVFAALLGTLELLEPDERKLIRGLVINKFRGDVQLLIPGLNMLEARTKKLCLGVVHHVPDLTLDEEDSLGRPALSNDIWLVDTSPARRLRIAVLALPSLSNFTDFDSLRAEPSVDLRLVQTPVSLAHADVVILPGSKQTAADLAWVQMRQLGEAIQRTPFIAGICGGMQMLGNSIEDPQAVEHGGTVGGLSLLPFDTVMRKTKSTVLTSANLSQSRLFGHEIPATRVSGYEIHVGETRYLPEAQPFAVTSDGRPEGCIAGCVFGTYLHGIFDDDIFRQTFIAAARAHQRLAPAPEFNDWHAQREHALNSFAAHVERSLNMPEIFSWAGLTYARERG